MENTSLFPGLGKQRHVALCEFKGQPGLQIEFQDNQGLSHREDLS